MLSRKLYPADYINALACKVALEERGLSLEDVARPSVSELLREADKAVAALPTPPTGKDTTH